MPPYYAGMSEPVGEDKIRGEAVAKFRKEFAQKVRENLENPEEILALLDEMQDGKESR